MTQGLTRAQQQAVWLLAIGQTMTYAGVYYAFPALLPDIEAMTGWSKSALALGPTLSFLVMAPFGMLTGRLVDRGWGGEMLAYLPILAAIALAALGHVGSVHGWMFLWAVIGIAQAGCLYETCFAFLTRRLGGNARSAITRVTLVAGFAGTLAFPLGGWLGRTLGAAGAFEAFALLMVVVAVPANFAAVRILRASERASVAGRAATKGAVWAAMKKPAFWAIAGIFGFDWLNHGILLTYVLTIFEDRGASHDGATFAAACIGPSQVLGRLALMVNEARVGNRRATYLALTSVCASSLILSIAGFAPWLILATALCQGAGVGMMSILRPVLIADYLGRDGFGAISGAVAVSPILASAAAPVVGAWLLAVGGVDLVLGACITLAVSALLLWLVVGRRQA